MIWEKQVFVIVMTTKLVEQGKVKCTQYWPDERGIVLYGEVSVQMMKKQVYQHYELRTFKVRSKVRKRRVLA